MSDETDTITANSPTATKRSDSGRFMTVLSIFLMLILLAVFGVGYFNLAKVNLSLAQRVTELQNKTLTNEQKLSDLQKSQSEMRHVAEASQVLAEKQEHMIQDWQNVQKGDLNKWYIAEAQYLVRLANDNVQLTHNITVAMTLLQRADEILQNLQDTDVTVLRQSIAEGLADLKALPQVDVTGLYMQLSALNSQIDQLPLPLNPLKPDSASNAPVVEPPGTSWWQAGWDYTIAALRKIVIVRHNTGSALPLVMPEEKVFLYQNLHAQFENAMWAVLNRNAEVYGASLTRASNWIEQYFNHDANATKAVLQTLQELQKINIQRPVANLNTTVQRFDHYLTPAGTAKPA